MGSPASSVDVEARGELLNLLMATDDQQHWNAAGYAHHARFVADAGPMTASIAPIGIRLRSLPMRAVRRQNVGLASAPPGAETSPCAILSEAIAGADEKQVFIAFESKRGGVK